MKDELSRKISATFMLYFFIVSFFVPSIMGADKLPPPVLTKPSEGEHLDILTPTFEWEAVPDATKYGLYIYRYADEYWNIDEMPETWWIHLKIFDSISITGTSFDLPAGFLKSGIRYQWYMTSFSGEVEGDQSIVQSFSTSITNGGVRGIDVSHHQGRIDWDALCKWEDNKGRHMEFVYVRATYGIDNLLATIEANSEGEILYHKDNDIYADGYEWWHVNFGDKTGWMAENGMEKLDNPADKEFVPGDKVKTVTSYNLRTLPGIIDNGVIDSNLIENMEGIRAHNIGLSGAERLLAGVYHYARPGLNDAVSEARHFVAVAGDCIKPGFLRPMLDLEEEGFDSAWVHLFSNTVKQLTGAEPLIYILPSWANDYLDDSVGVYDLWTTRPLYRPSPCPPNYFPQVGAETSIRWDSWVIWQYGVTDKYSRNLPGVNADNLPESYAVDLDVFNGDRAALEEFLIAGYSPLDVYMLVDLSGSFADDLPIFKAQAPNMIMNLEASFPGTRFGLGKFEDYPIHPFGDASSGDKAYERIIDLTFDTDAVLSCISSLFTRYGEDGPQSQLPALYQAATGAGQDLSGVGFPGASIPPGQQANFRDGATKLFVLWTDAPFHNPGDPGTIPYPGPSFDETVEAINSLDPPMVIGISSGSGGVADLRRMAVATGALAPAGGVDTNGDGIIDILEGQPLVCAISPSGVGIAEAIEALVGAAAVLPIADANGPYEGEVGTVIVLDGSKSFDSDGYIALYEWDFDGDGIFDFSSAEGSTSHIYETAFTGVVALRVTDNDGNTDTDEAAITIVQADSLPPETWLAIGDPKCLIDETTYLTSATSMTLLADDNPGGTGVASTSYRIYNATYDSGWLVYSAPFYLTGLPDGEYSIDYYSTDNTGNTEQTNTVIVALGFVNATVAFDYEALNLKSRGDWVTVYVELPEGYNVNNIDVSTIMLNGTIPAELEPTAVGDNDSDGIPDVTVRFNRTLLVEYLILKGIASGNVTLTITGLSVLEKTEHIHPVVTVAFEGSSNIKVSSLVGDVDCDGTVGLFDAVKLLASYGSWEGDANWNPNANFAPSWKLINLYDTVMLGAHYGETSP